MNPTPPSAEAPIGPSREAEVHFLGLRGATVVIVDDEAIARFALDQMVRGIDPGIRTALFADGREALAWLGVHDPDLIITDWRMPGMTGIELIAELRQARRLPHVPVMVITAAGERALRYAALDAGAIDFIAKPIDPLEVQTRCRNLLLLTHQHRSLKKYSVLLERQVEQLQSVLQTLLPQGTANVARPVGPGELVSVTYAKLVEIAGYVSGCEALVSNTQQLIADLEQQLALPLRRRPEEV
ncbi:MAG: response regulator [Betaproteobacteria bacterium]